ncbi:hypothetical protein NAF17_17350 [Mucilaginibacter sp. RB4R14]|uniref:hypothetical protein n=1 Tax=Mucilaginibacter aurantiaciroseus TaxID=2949308 RepID=UPI002090E999|nr:hypothetical protein [Mucilaginibacter aurantiaciroseus]MCO5937317.1 hypothetical protein [Mucilaginibacter aurantiaciroseus]
MRQWRHYQCENGYWALYSSSTHDTAKVSCNSSGSKLSGIYSTVRNTHWWPLLSSSLKDFVFIPPPPLTTVKPPLILDNLSTGSFSGTAYSLW